MLRVAYSLSETVTRKKDTKLHVTLVRNRQATGVFWRRFLISVPRALLQVRYCDHLARTEILEQSTTTTAEVAVAGNYSCKFAVPFFACRSTQRTVLRRSLRPYKLQTRRDIGNHSQQAIYSSAPSGARCLPNGQLYCTSLLAADVMALRSWQPTSSILEFSRVASMPQLWFQLKAGKFEIKKKTKILKLTMLMYSCYIQLIAVDIFIGSS